MIYDKRLILRVLQVLLLALWTCDAGASEDGVSSYVPDKAIPFAYPSEAADPGRTRPLLELGDPFLGNGNLRPGYRLPGGAVWQPRLWIYGNYWSSLHSYQLDNGSTTQEWANRLELYSNLQLTGSERDGNEA